MSGVCVVQRGSFFGTANGSSFCGRQGVHQQLWDIWASLVSCSENGPYFGTRSGVRIAVRLGRCVHVRSIDECFSPWCCGSRSIHLSGFIVATGSSALCFMTVWFREFCFVPFLLLWRFHEMMILVLSVMSTLTGGFSLCASYNQGPLYAWCLPRLTVAFVFARM